MPGFMQVRTQPTANAGVPFRATVLVFGASPGDVVTIRLAQTAGAAPPYSQTTQVTIAGDGSGIAVFDDVVLHGAGSEARLLADDISSPLPLAAGDAHIQVVP